MKSDDNTYAPYEPRFSGIVKIKIDKNAIYAEYVKNNDFRMLMKKLNFRWHDVWYRKIEPLNGSVEDRAAELVNALLCEGFTIYIKDKKIVEKAVNADFELEITRWITTYSERQICIKIKYGETNLYKQAKKLSGARWQKGFGMIIDCEYYDEIEDFVKMFGYKITPKADAQLKKARAEREKILEKKIKVKPPEKIKEVNGLKDILNSSREVLDELKD